MKLEEIHFINLKLIYNAPDQCLLISDFVSKTSFPEKLKTVIIEDLLSFDLIETEKNPDIYFLTTEGYMAVEQEWTADDFYFDNEEIEIITNYDEFDSKQSTSNNNLKQTWKVLFLFAAMYTVNAGYQKYFGVKKEKEINFQISKEQLESLKMNNRSSILTYDSLTIQNNFLNDQLYEFRDSLSERDYINL